MSSNVPTNEQNANTGSGSDTDSVSSITSQVAVLNMERSSPPPLLSSDFTDDEEGNITVTKDDVSNLADENPDEEGQIPFLDKHGEPLTESTPPGDFVSWPEYLLYCGQGAKLTVRLAVTKDGLAVGFHKVDYPKKVLVDHSEYFGGLDRAGRAMGEGESGYVDLDDVDIVSFQRLYMVISSGHPGSFHNIGPSFSTLSDLLDCAVLADRFLMRQIEGWIRVMMENYLDAMANWTVQYQHAVVNHAGMGLAAHHQRRVIDVSDAWERTVSMRNYEINLPIQPRRYVTFLVSVCPRALLAQMIPQLPPQLVIELAREMLIPSA